MASAQAIDADPALIAALERARRVDDWPSTIRDSLVAPQWLTSGDRVILWDAIGPAAGSWVLVDAATGRRRSIVSAADLRTRLASLVGTDTPLPRQMPFTVTPDDRALLFRHVGASYRLDLATSHIGKVAAESLDAYALMGGAVAPDGKSVAVRDGDGFVVRDPTGKPLLARTGMPDLAWHLPDQPWSPDGRLAVWQVDQRAVHRIPIVDYSNAVERVTMVPYAKVGTPIAEARLHLIDPASGAVTPARMSEDAGYRWLAGWRGDGAALVLHMARDGKRLDLLAVSSTGSVTRVLREEHRETKVADLNFAVEGWRWQVKQLAQGRGFLWMSERDGWRHVYHYRDDGRLIRQVTRGRFPVVRVEGAADDGTLLVTATPDAHAPYDERLYRVPLGGGALRAVATQPGVHRATSSPSGRYLVDSRSSWTSPRVRDLLRIDGTPVARLTTADATAVAATGRPLPEPTLTLAADGTTPLHGMIYRPSGFDPARRYPVVAYIYGGPFSTVVARGFTGSSMMRRAETLAAAGFVVVAVDVRGSAGRSKAFGDATYGRLGQIEIPDYVTSLRQIAATRPWMDLSRLGIHGHSWGGYFAIRAMLTAPDMFKAGYAGAPGALDEDALVNEPDMGLHAANPAGYASGSNVALADRLAAPLRILHGAADTNAPLSSSMRLAGALVRARKPVESLILPGVGHDLEGAAADYYRDDVIRFFDHTLGGSQSPRP